MLSVARIGALSASICDSLGNMGEVEPNDNLSRATPVVFISLGDSFYKSGTGPNSRRGSVSVGL